tara:strand:- start:3315 stop:3881 length:567 start_codon:yes stop_codon:yes gene_type:complete
MFSLGMKLRLVSEMLEQMWKHRKERHGHSLRTAKTQIEVISNRVRHFMSFFISNLVYHMQVDVVDLLFNAMLEDIGKASTFGDVIRSHRNFVAAMASAAFLDDIAIQESFERVVQICIRFIALMDIHDTHLDVTDGEGIVVEMQEIEREFFGETRFLFQVLRKVDTKGLLLKLDFNHFFSQSIADSLG